MGRFTPFPCGHAHAFEITIGFLFQGSAGDIRALFSKLQDRRLEALMLSSNDVRCC